MKLKKISAIFIILSMVFLTGCWNSREINTLAIAVCTGIDKAEEGYLVTHQIINPKVIASKKATNEAPVIIYSETGDSLFEIYRKLTTECPRKIYNSHLRMVIFGEEIAKEGIQDFIDFFARVHEFRTDFYFAVAKGTTANNVLSMLTPLETLPGMEMYDSLKASEENWAPTKTIRIIELINSILADGKDPVLTGIEVTGGDVNSNSTDALRQSDQIKKLKYTSLGAFNEDRLAGWLNEDESKGYNYIMGNVKSTAGHADYGDKVKIIYEVMNTKSKMKASLVNGKPVIDVEIHVNANIGSVQGQFDVSKEENKEILKQLPEEAVKLLCNKTLKKAQKDLGTDIFGFGEVIHRQYPKVWEKIKDDWDNEFEDLPVNITVNFKVSQLGQITKPFFIKENE